MLMCWGPYVLMCIYACFENVKVVSPKLRMVSTFSLIHSNGLWENDEKGRKEVILLQPV